MVLFLVYAIVHQCMLMIKIYISVLEKVPTDDTTITAEEEYDIDTLNQEKNIFSLHYHLSNSFCMVMVRNGNGKSTI